MIRYLTSYFYDYEFNTLTPNSMYILPKNKFVNFAREKVESDDDEEPNKTIWDFKKWEKEQGYKTQISRFEALIDQLNH